MDATDRQRDAEGGEGRGGGEEGEGRGGEVTHIKSNNPHLTGGEKYFCMINSFFSFLFIFLFLDARERLTFNLWASKSVKQIDNVFFHLCDSPKGANASLKATGSSFLHLKGRCTINGGGYPTLFNKTIHRGFLAAFQVSMLFTKFCIDGTPQGCSQITEDDNMPC